jgi:hypothetical protein
MRRPLILAMTVILAMAASAVAGDLNSGPAWWRSFWTDWHRNNWWPEPFVAPDAADVCATFHAEVLRGWEQQNLLGDAHFESDNSKLSPAGVTKLRWIMTQNPLEFRMAFIERATTEDITARRLAAAQQAAAEIAPSAVANVAVSDMRMFTTPSGQVLGINAWLVKYQSTIPAPSLPAFQSSGSSGGSSGGGGGGGGSQ